MHEQVWTRGLAAAVQSCRGRRRNTKFGPPALASKVVGAALQRRAAGISSGRQVGPSHPPSHLSPTPPGSQSGKLEQTAQLPAGDDRDVPRCAMPSTPHTHTHSHTHHAPGLAAPPPLCHATRHATPCPVLSGMSPVRPRGEREGTASAGETGTRQARYGSRPKQWRRSLRSGPYGVNEAQQKSRQGSTADGRPTTERTARLSAPTAAAVCPPGTPQERQAGRLQAAAVVVLLVFACTRASC